MGRRIAQLFRAVARRRQNDARGLAVAFHSRADEDGADRHLTARSRRLRLGERKAHETIRIRLLHRSHPNRRFRP